MGLSVFRYYGLWNTELILCRILIRANRRTKVLDLVVTINDTEKIEAMIVTKIVANEQMENQGNKNQEVPKSKSQNRKIELDRRNPLDLHLHLILKNIQEDRSKLSKRRKIGHQHQRKSHDHLHR